MAAQWVVQAAQFAGKSLDLLNTLSQSSFSRTMGGISDDLTRKQIEIASEADAAARIRATGNLISSQRAALGASGVAGGRTARLLEARVRINSAREQRQADQSAVFQKTASRIKRIQNRSRARSAAYGAAQDLLTFGLSSGDSPGDAGG